MPTRPSAAPAASMLAAPHIVTELPGPRARALIARDQRTVSPSLTRAYPLVAESGSGYTVTDVDGNRFLDFAAGIAVVSTGHSHPAVVAAISEQAQRLIHIAATDFYEPRYVEFSEKLAAIAPFREPARVFLTNSGTEAVEGAIKLARFHTGRPGIIAFEGGFHGRTMGALSLTNSKIRQRAGFGPLLPMVEHAPFPRVRTWREQSGGDGTAELDVLRHAILGRIMAPRDVAAIVVEPIQGEGGYFPAPAAFLAGLREICDEHGILLIADEIQSGMGRTGRWWAMQHPGIEPARWVLAYLANMEDEGVVILPTHRLVRAPIPADLEARLGASFALRPAEGQEREPVFSLLGEERYALGIETIYEGYLLHYGSPRLFAPEDGDTALLLGDYLYAHGLVRIEESGTVDAVNDLAELIALCAYLRAEQIAGDGAVWAATACSLGRRVLDPGRSSLRLDNDPSPLERIARAVGTGAAVGASRAALRRAPERRFRRSHGARGDRLRHLGTVDPAPVDRVRGDASPGGRDEHRDAPHPYKP